MEFKDNVAIYLQIAELVCEKILTAKLLAGQKILSVRDFAVELEVNPNTVMRSYDLLQELKIIFNRRGHGLYVAEDGLERVIAWRKQNFLEEEMPNFFKNISLLQISMEEISRQYERFLVKQQTANAKKQDHENKH